MWSTWWWDIVSSSPVDSFFLYILIPLLMCFALRIWASLFHLKLAFPSVFMIALEKSSCWTRMDFTLWKEQGKALQNTVEGPGLYLFILEVVAAEDEGSKDTKLCMNYDVICSAFSPPLGRPSKLVFSEFFSGGHTIIFQIWVWGCFPSYITHK